jgi:hypothetical protein
MAETTAFEPKNYLTRISGADYLEVKWRLVWFRNENPNGRIETELMSHDGDTAIFRARVEIPDHGSATGWGSEASSDFGDYIEKAETKALGRALAALGYGTQFCPDFEFGAEQNRVVDSPIDLNRTRARRTKASPEQMPATERQIKFLFAMAHEVGISDEDLNRESQETFGEAVDKLRRREASTLIERLQQRREAAHAAS